jgi:hypothetical protein
VKFPSPTSKLPVQFTCRVDFAIETKLGDLATKFHDAPSCKIYHFKFPTYLRPKYRVFMNAFFQPVICPCHPLKVQSESRLQLLQKLGKCNLAMYNTPIRLRGILPMDEDPFLFIVTAQDYKFYSTVCVCVCVCE